MIKHTIEISREPVHLSVRLNQLVVQPFDQPKEAERTIPCEDIGVVLVDHPRVTFTHQALAALMKAGASVVVCGGDHLPAGIMLPTNNHTELVKRLDVQISASLPTKKQLWRQLVVEKVKTQARNVTARQVAHARLLNLAEQVKSGDTTNIEAQAARLYWEAWRAEWEPEFRRDPDRLDPTNAMLNYGYAVLRAALGRALVAGGFNPAMGLHHRNRSNAFCLADDLVEPLRPLIDRRVRSLRQRKRDQLDQPTKAYLLAVLTENMAMDGETGPLMVTLHRMTASLGRCLTGQDKGLLIPAMLEADE